jgi:hypothetical protein
MAIDAKLLTLIMGLRDATRRGKLHWIKGDTHQVFFTNLPDHSRVLIEEGRDLNGDQYFNISIFKDFHELIEMVMVDSSEELELVNELFVQARRNALRFDHILDSMIESVNLLKS